MKLSTETADPRASRGGLAASRVGGGESPRDGLAGLHGTFARDEGQPALDPDGQLQNVKLPIKQLLLFTRQMAMLLTSGSALVPALAAIAQQMKSPTHRRMLALAQEELERGKPLADALAEFPRSFDASYRAVIAAGESSATLPAMFSRLASIIAKRRALRNKLIGSLVYPALLIMLSLGIMSVMLFFVVPRFNVMFENLGVTLPTSTAILLTMSEQLRRAWFVPLAALLACVVGVIWSVRTDRGQLFLSNIQIRIPLVGRLRSRLIQGQSFRILGMLLEARVGLIEAMDLAKRVTRNDRYQALYDDMDDSVTRGEAISGAMERSGLIDASIVQAVRTGEQSGRMGESITYVADVLDEDNAELLAAVTKLIEPSILIGMGMIVGVVALSLFMPLFDMTSAV